MKRFFHIAAEGHAAPKSSLEECLKARGPGGYIWLDFTDPAREDLEPLLGPLGIHRLSLEDCLDDDQIPKIENFDDTSFLLLNAFDYDAGRLILDETDFIIGKDFLVTVRSAGLRTSWDEAPLEAGLRREAREVGRGPDFLLHFLVNRVVDAKIAPVEAIEGEIESVEEAILKDSAGFDLRRLSHLRRSLLALRKDLFHEREALSKICRRDSPFFTERSIYHFRDVHDHMTKLFEEVEIYREMIMDLAEMHLSLANNRMARIANRTNLTVRRLTFITTIFMPLTLLASIGGMSEYSMMTGPQNWRVSYAIFIASMAVLGGATYLALRWMDDRSPHEDE